MEVGTRYEYMQTLKEFYEESKGLEVTLGISILREYTFLLEGLPRTSINRMKNVETTDIHTNTLYVDTENSNAEKFIRGIRNVIAHVIISQPDLDNKYHPRYRHQIIKNKKSLTNKRLYTSVELINVNDTFFDKIVIGNRKTTLSDDEYNENMKEGFLELFDEIMRLYLIVLEIEDMNRGGWS